MKTFKRISIFLTVVSIVSLPLFAFAQVGQTPPTPQGGSTGTQTNTSPINIPNPLATGTNSFLDLLNLILNKIVMPIAAVAVVVYIVYAGFTFLTAQGNPKKIEEAKQRLLWALIGAGILLGAAGISAVVQNTVSSLITH